MFQTKKLDKPEWSKKGKGGSEGGEDKTSVPPKSPSKPVNAGDPPAEEEETDDVEDGKNFFYY